MRTALVMATALPLAAGALTVGIPTARADSAPSGRDTLSATKPAWATASSDRGAAADSGKVTARVYLAGRDAKGLAEYATAVSDPSSPAYGRYLTAQQARARFGPTRQQTEAVSGWLRGSGLTVTGHNQHYLSVTGEVAAAEKAFGTQLHNYTKDGTVYRAPSKAATVPASLGGAVLTVVGLDTAPKRAEHMATRGETLPPPGAVFKNAGPFSTYYGSKVNTSLPSAYGAEQPYAVKGYTGKQLRAAYGAKSRHTGKGVTVAITDAYASPTIAADAARYARRNGDPAYRKGQLTQVLPAEYRHTEECDASGWYGEETLDVEAVHAVAPASDLVYVGGASCPDDDLLDALAKVVDNRLADIVSNSWGDVEANQTPDLAPPTTRSSSRARSRASASTSPPATTATTSPPPAPSRSTPPPTRPWVTAVGGTSLAVGKGRRTSGRPAGAPPVHADAGRQQLGPPARRVHLRRRRRHQQDRSAAVLPARCGAGRAREGERRNARSASCRTSRPSPTPTPASWWGRRRPSPTGRSSTASTASAAPRWPPR